MKQKIHFPKFLFIRQQQLFLIGMDSNTNETLKADVLNGIWIGSCPPYPQYKCPTNPIFWTLSAVTISSVCHIVGAGYNSDGQEKLFPFLVYGKFDPLTRFFSVKKKYLPGLSIQAVEVKFEGKLNSKSKEELVIEGTWFNESSLYSGTFVCMKQIPSPQKQDTEGSPISMEKLIGQVKEQIPKLNKNSTELENIKLLLDETTKLLNVQIEETKRREQLNQCAICMESSPRYAIVPCGHLCLCEKCKGEITDSHCPVCRSKANQILKVFF
ncbi:MAG: RING-HC finger protein [Actinobacteria bacterium]|nr:RING-HC finger protein [Actinomycetota bacterium]